MGKLFYKEKKIMTVMDCAYDCGRVYQTVLRWVNSGKVKCKKIGLRENYIDPEDWDQFCTDNNILSRRNLKK